MGANEREWHRTAKCHADVRHVQDWSADNRLYTSQSLIKKKKKNLLRNQVLLFFLFLN